MDTVAGEATDMTVEEVTDMTAEEEEEEEEILVDVAEVEAINANCYV